MQLAHSVLVVKRVVTEAREFDGIATTPTVDYVGDVINPMGAQFNTPMPLLWQHDHASPVGHVTSAKPTPTGINIRAKILKIDEPGMLKDTTDYAWHAVKYGLVRGLSVGFKAVAKSTKIIPETGGVMYDSWRWYETSLVTLPCNMDATVSVIRSFDVGSAALGNLAQANGLPVNIRQPESNEFMLISMAAHYNYQIRSKRLVVGVVESGSMLFDYTLVPV